MCRQSANCVPTVSSVIAVTIMSIPVTPRREGELFGGLARTMSAATAASAAAAKIEPPAISGSTGQGVGGPEPNALHVAKPISIMLSESRIHCTTACRQPL